jgi:hypothetical protein
VQHVRLFQLLVNKRSWQQAEQLLHAAEALLLLNETGALSCVRRCASGLPAAATSGNTQSFSCVLYEPRQLLSVAVVILALFT